MPADSPYSCSPPCPILLFFFFFNDTATTEIYTLSLHDALPISLPARRSGRRAATRTFRRALYRRWVGRGTGGLRRRSDRKSTRLNSSHGYISYAVFCLKKKKKTARVNMLLMRHDVRSELYACSE